MLVVSNFLQPLANNIVTAVTDIAQNINTEALW